MFVAVEEMLNIGIKIHVTPWHFSGEIFVLDEDLSRYSGPSERFIFLLWSPSQLIHKAISNTV